MENSPVLYETIQDGVRATIRREGQGCSILLSPVDAAAPHWADNLQLSGEMPAVRKALVDAETWLAANPLANTEKPKG